MCGGPTGQQKQAAGTNLNLGTTTATQGTADTGTAGNFFSNVTANGLPYFNAQTQYSSSDIAKQINQAKANAARANAGYGGALPSGFASQENTDIGIGGAQAFDQNMLSLLAQQFAAKMGGAQSLGNLGTAEEGVGTQANQSVLQAPLQNSFWPNLISGLVQGGMKVAAAPLGL